jgi:hypothetical protein
LSGVCVAPSTRNEKSTHAICTLRRPELGISRSSKRGSFSLYPATRGPRTLTLCLGITAARTAMDTTSAALGRRGILPLPPPWLVIAVLICPFILTLPDDGESKGRKRDKDPRTPHRTAHRMYATPPRPRNHDSTYTSPSRRGDDITPAPRDRSIARFGARAHGVDGRWGARRTASDRHATAAAGSTDVLPRARRSLCEGVINTRRRVQDLGWTWC